MTFSRHAYSGPLFDVVLAKLDLLGAALPAGSTQEEWLVAVDGALGLALGYKASLEALAKAQAPAAEKTATGGDCGTLKSRWRGTMLT